MRKFEYFSLALWLLLLFICTLVGMIAGPLGYDALSMAFSAAACVLSVGLIFYCLYFWCTNKK